jgi:hypothetical protein
MGLHSAFRRKTPPRALAPELLAFVVHWLIFEHVQIMLAPGLEVKHYLNKFK